MNDENTATEPATTDITPDGTPDMVSIPEADDADIAAFLKNAGANDEPDLEDPEVEQPSSPSEAPQSQPDDEEPQQDPAQPKAEVREEPAKDEAALAAENEKLRRQIEQQEQFIQRTRSEYGAVKKALKEANERLRAGLDDKYTTAPAEATADLLQIRENEAKIKEFDAAETRLTEVHEAQKLVSQHIKPGEVTKDEIAASLRRDGLPEEYIRTFVENPYQSADGVTLIHIAKRAKAESLLGQAGAIIRQQREQIAKLSGKPLEVARNISKALAAPPPVTAASGGGSSRVEFSGDVSQLSNADLKALKTQLLKQERSK